MLLPLYAAYQWLRGARRNWAMYAGMVGVLALYLAMRIHALGGLAPAQQTFFHLTGLEFAMSAAVLLARYFAALVWPLDLNFFHVFHPTTGASWQLIVSLVALGRDRVGGGAIRMARAGRGLCRFLDCGHP